MSSESVEVRTAAIQALFPVFYPDAFVIRTLDDFDLNPDYHKALARMAAGDANAELRKAAANALQPETIRRRVARILRDREQQSRERKGGERKSVRKNY